MCELDMQHHLFKRLPAHCNTLQQIATHCNPLQHTATSAVGTRDVRIRYAVSLAQAPPYTLRQTAAHCNMLQHLLQARTTRKTKDKCAATLAPLPQTPPNILQHAATHGHGNTLQHAATCTTRETNVQRHGFAQRHLVRSLGRLLKYCNTLERTATHGSTRQHAATRCNTCCRHARCARQMCCNTCSTPSDAS